MYIELLSILSFKIYINKGECLSVDEYCDPGKCCNGLYCNEDLINECEYCLKDGDDCSYEINFNDEPCCNGLKCTIDWCPWNPWDCYYKCQPSSWATPPIILTFINTHQCISYTLLIMIIIFIIYRIVINKQYVVQQTYIEKDEF